MRSENREQEPWVLRHLIVVGIAIICIGLLTDQLIQVFVPPVITIFDVSISDRIIETALHLVGGTMIVVLLTLLANREVKKRQKIEEILRKSIRETELFAYSVIHDLKNPAIAVHGLTKRLVRHHQGGLDNLGREHLRLVLESSSKVLALIQQIQVYIKTKELPLKFEIVDSRELVKMAREEFYRQLNENLIKWRESTELPKIKADRIAISRVMRNLIDNALKYGGDSLTEIKVQYVPSDQYHIFVVSDDGVGVSQESTEIIFDPFQRNDSCNKEGSGLGLAIVREIAKQHGGNAWAEISSPRGTKFYFSIAKDL